MNGVERLHPDQTMSVTAGQVFIADMICAEFLAGWTAKEPRALPAELGRAFIADLMAAAATLRP